MSDWKTLDLLTPEDQVRARELFTPEEREAISDYEFSYFGKKLVRRVRPELTKRDAKPLRKKAPAPSTPAGNKTPFLKWPELNGKQRKEVQLRFSGIMTSEQISQQLWRFQDGELIGYIADDGKSDREKEVAIPSEVPAGNATPGVERVLRVALKMVVDSPLQPRTNYDAVKLKELAASVKDAGIIQPLIVREKCHGLVFGEDVADVYETIAGHRRRRAAEIAGLADLPVIVRNLSDAQVVECHLIEILVRDDLTAIEEANGLQDALALMEVDGSPRFTRETLGSRIGRSEVHIGRQLSLLRLPEKAKESINTGVIGPAIGYLIAAVPSASMRSRLTGEVLKGFDGQPMSKREVVDHIRRFYVKQLRDAPFDKASVDLVPVKVEGGERCFGGACDDCMLNSANMPEAGEQKFHFCTLPACFLAKVEAHVGEIKDKALAAGAVVVTGEKAAQYLYHDGTPKNESGMIDLKTAPLPSETVGRKAAPKWEAMVSGESKAQIVMSRDEKGEKVMGGVSGKLSIPTTVVFDDQGKAHWLAPRKLAIEAAKKNGFGDIFTASSTGAKSSRDANDKQRKTDENVKKKIESAVGVAGMEALTVEISKQGLKAEAWPALVEIALFHSGGDALAYFIQRRGLTDGRDREKIVRAYVRKLEAVRLPAMVVELLLAGWMKLKGVDAPGFAALAKVYELNVAAIRGEVKGKAAEKKKPKAKPDKPEPPIRDLIADLAKKRGMGLIAVDDLAQKHCGKCYAVLKGPELTALRDAIKAVPIPEKKKKGSRGRAEAQSGLSPEDTEQIREAQKQRWQKPKDGAACDLVIVGCGKTKVETGDKPVAARDLYTGPLFEARREYAERCGAPWLILSAEHGLISPDEPLLTYDSTPRDLSADEKSEVQRVVIKKLIEHFGSEAALEGKVIEIHAAAIYVRLVREVSDDFCPRIVTPMEGLGIGQQLSYYDSRAKPAVGTAAKEGEAQ